MPDWTYHPFFKQLLFVMPPEESRRLTLWILEMQARTAAGRRLFRVFGHGLPPKELSVSALGMTFPGPIGLAPGIDTAATSLSVMQHLGFGFIEVGPVTGLATSRDRLHDPVRLRGRQTLIQSPYAASHSALEVASKISQSPDLRIPVGIALYGTEDQIAGAIEDASESASFFTLPYSATADEVFKRLRATTRKPLLVRIPAELCFDQIERRLASLTASGLSGCVAVAGASTPILRDGEIDGPFITAKSLRMVEQIANKFGDQLSVIGSGGVMRPDDALSLLDAGASLVELYAGLVFAGPGLPGRIVHALEHRLEHASDCAQKINSPTKIDKAKKFSEPAEKVPLASPVSSRMGWLRAHGWITFAFTGGILIASGLFAIVLAATVKLLPYDFAYLGMTADQLCQYHDCHILHFMAHDRVSFGGSIIAIGVLYLWLAFVPLRRGESWAWWALAISGCLGFGSFLTYLSYGYLDVWHGLATLALLIVFGAGLVLSYSTLRGTRGIRSVFQSPARAWLWSPAGRGKALMVFTAIGMILGGATIMAVGMTRVFVPQDLEYLRMSIPDLQAVSPRLISLIAHDRSGFGGGLCSTGMAILISVWCGLRPGAKGLWFAWLIAGIVGFACAIGVHPIVGYTSFVHLLPAYIGAASFICGMASLYKPMCRLPSGSDRFPDF